MDALRLLVRAGVRRRRAGLAATAVLLALGIGTGLGALAVAWKTDRVYADYLRRADVNELVVNPSLVTDHLIDLVRSTPGVVDMVTDATLAATPDDGHPRPRHDIEETPTLFLTSLDGRYVTHDRPVIAKGRMIRSGDEAFVSAEAAAQLGLQVGDELPITFWPAASSGAPPDEIIDPIATHQARVVGIGVFADEVLADELYPRQRIVLSPDLAARYVCIATQPAADDARSIEELTPLFFPSTCSSDAQLFSLHVAGGDRGVNALIATLSDRLAAESARLPAALQAINASFEVIPTVTAVERERIRLSLEPSVTALRLLGLAATIATVVLSSLALLRAAREREGDLTIWHQLGITRWQRALAVAVPAVGAIVAGLIGSIVIGWLASSFGPVASAHTLSPSADPSVPVPVAVAVLSGALFALCAAALLIGWTVSPVGRTLRPTGVTRAGPALSRGGVAFTLGVRAGLRGRGGAGALLLATAIAVTVVLGTVIFSVNLAHLVGSPARFGWPYDVGVVVNYGFGGADDDAISATLDRPEVAAWGVGATTGTARVGDETMPMIADSAGLAGVGLAIVDGSLPRSDDEVALGSVSARHVGASVGDRVTVTTEFGARDATVTGIVVLPPIGRFLSDRAGLGTGMLVSGPFFEALAAEGERAAGLPAGTLSANVGGFVAIDLRDGTDRGQFVAAIASDVGRWDVNGLQIVHASPVRPAQITDVASMRAAPVLLASFIAVTMVAGLALALHRAAHTRRHELAVLRVLGCRGRQLYATLRWQALTIVIVGLVLGVPVGVGLGRRTWSAFASRLGVVSTPEVPIAWVAIVIGAVIVIATLVALPPGRVAASISPAAALRDE